MAGHPLRPATRLCLGGPLPRQLADGTRTHLLVRAPCGRPLSLHSSETTQTHAALAILSDCYSPPEGRLSTCYAPVRRFTQGLPLFLARLACVKPAANVRSEPGSNSPIKVRFAWNNLGETCSLKVFQGYLLLSFSLSPSIQFSAAYVPATQIVTTQLVPGLGPGLRCHTGASGDKVFKSGSLWSQHVFFKFLVVFWNLRRRL